MTPRRPASACSRNNPRAALVSACLILAVACGSGSSPTSPDAAVPGPLVFTVSPIDTASIQYIVPLGNMGPWAHTLPTDHIYVYHGVGTGAVAPEAIVVPAAGTVDFLIHPDGSNEVKLAIRVNSTYSYYFDHLTLAPGIGLGTHLDTGAAVGTSVGIAFDFAVVNYALTLGFVNPLRYGGTGGYTVHTDAPLKYFTEPIRSALYAKVQREGPELDGRIDYDVPGTLSGNWFAEGLPPSMSMGGDMNTGTKQLAFARDVRYPDRLRISIGGLGLTGVWGVPPNTADFSSVTPASGIVTYRLLYPGDPGGPAGTQQAGLLVAQMLDNERIRVQAVADQTATTAAFGSGAQIYVR